MASVGGISETNRTDRHYAELRDFDPATMDVLIVAKDARRVWVDRDKAFTLTTIHTEKPLFNASYDAWESSGEITTDEVVITEAAHNDCVEFVAIATHRPPEPRKPTTNEPTMAELLADPSKRSNLMECPQCRNLVLVTCGGVCFPCAAANLDGEPVQLPPGCCREVVQSQFV